jgi:RHS repeat-associated protein
MGILEDVDAVVTSAVTEAKKMAGTVIDTAAHVTGDALSHVGLNDAAQAVGTWGDHVADNLGDEIPEKQLGQTTDRTELVHGDVNTINAAAGHLRNFATAFGNTSQGLSAIDTSHWAGDAATAFQAVYVPHTEQWTTAQQACGNAATALSGYAGTVGWAQDQAQQAINLYQQGTQATQQAQTQYNAQVDAYNTAAQNYNAAFTAGDDPGTPPAQPAPFTDPGAALRQQAQQLLDQARQRRDAAAQTAAGALADATNLAPQKPSVLEQVADDIADVQEGLDIGALHFAGGVVKGAAGIVDFARGLNPADPYNVTHPAEYATSLSATAAGLAEGAMHPTRLVSALVGSGWGSDPFEAMGKLVPNVALGLLTDGAGTAAGAGERAAIGVGEQAVADTAERAAVATGEDAATAGVAGSTARDEAGQAIETTRDPNGTPCQNDPVDVATGQVLLPQVDVDLPGALPLVLARVHLSGYRLGRWFGRTWASTLDMRLEVDPLGVIFVGADGVRLFYPQPGVDTTVLPYEGARWPLRRTESGGYTIEDPVAGRKFHFHRPTGSGRWPIGAISDRNGHRMKFGYHAGGVPAEVEHDGGYRVRITVDDDRVTALHLVCDGEPDVELMRYGYTDGNLTEVVCADGPPLRLTYDQAGRLVEWLDRNDERYEYHYDADGRCVRTEGVDGVLSGTFDYDPDQRVTTHTDVRGAVTRYVYDESLRVVAETDPLGNTTRSTYHRYGWLLSRTDPLGRTVRYTRDDMGNATTVTRPDGSQVLVEYDASHQPTVVVEPDGAVWRYAYDERGNRTEVTDPGDATTRFGYTERGHLAAITDVSGNTTRLDTDRTGLSIAVTEPTGAISRSARDRFGRVVEQTDAAGRVTRLGWTPGGQIAWRTQPDGATERWHYDGEGNAVEYIDPAGRSTRREYTHFDRIAATVAPDGARVEFRYDDRLRLVSVTNQRGLVWRRGYDPAGRLLAETDFNGATTQFGHDPAGQLVGRTNPAGQTVSYRHDLLGNVVEQRSGGETTRYTHDPAGRLIHATNPDCELAIQRDVAGRVVAETVNGRTLTTTYDPVGRRLARVTPSGVRSNWEYDESGLPVAIRTAGHTVSFRHDQAGREVERQLDGVFGLVQTWDDTDRLTSQTLLDTATGMTMLQRRAYRYGSDGRLAAVVDHLSGTLRLDLDAAGRITTARTARGQETYRYDAAGNVTYAGWPVPDRPGPHHDPIGGRDYAGTLVTRAGAVRYRYDEAGRVVTRWRKRLSTKDHAWRYTWDADSRLVGVTTPDGTRWRYRYDPLGRRIAKQRLAPDGITVAEQVDFSWDGTRVVEQHHGAQFTTWEYDGAERPVTQVERVGGGQADQERYDQRFYAIVTDIVGTPTELVDSQGALAWHDRATTWGALPDGRPAPPLRFPGQYYDAESGLHYNYHRYYDPVTARYATPDPLGLLPGPNPYAYVSNPTALIDPLGLAPCSYLTQTGPNTYKSPAGLEYGPDPNPNFASRVDHVLNHAVDQPNRPLHGVFGATTDTGVLQDIDEAYQKVLNNDAFPVQQGNRTVSFVDMGRDIGMVGGQAGAAAGNPVVQYVQLVTENGNRVISAFPVSGISSNFLAGN